MTTPTQVAIAADMTDALPLDRLTLIGIFAKPDGKSALLRQDTGAIFSVVTGDATHGLTIAAIGDDSVHLIDAAGTAHVLTLPIG